ncbi:MAG: PQQ-dependent sugar dehydrogenase [Chloroflexi bacterium]|nr:PQQ-dependent sugar dehydrogenase [Chloroflexota bacterium]
MSRLEKAALALLLTLLVLPACSGRPAARQVVTPAPTQGVSPTPTQGVTPTLALPQVASSAQPTVGPPTLGIDVLVTGLEAPWAIDFAPDGRIFLTERPGRIRVVKDGQLQPDPWMTFDVARVSEAGLLGIALDPGFAENRFVYAAYTYRATDGRLQNRLVRLREDPATGTGTLDRVLLDGIAGSGIHDGGRVKFGPDGKLYWTMGDAANQALPQDLAFLNGKVLRLNPDGGIPADNPFPDSPVYSYGHRNPQGLAWQPATGRLYATEHGPSARDEVNYIEPGQNYGWPVITGDETRAGMASPIINSGSETWAPSGATFATKGPWAGSFLYTGLRGQALFRLTVDPADPRKVLAFERLLSGQYGRLRDVLEGPDGALYVLTNNRDGRGTPAPGDDKVLRLVVR